MSFLKNDYDFYIKKTGKYTLTIETLLVDFVITKIIKIYNDGELIENIEIIPKKQILKF